MDPPASWTKILATTSPAFQVLHRAIGKIVLARWPAAEFCVETKMACYCVPVEDAPSKDTWTGTMPRDFLVIAPTEKKAGITVHIWHPNHPYFLKENAQWLAAAGFKPMVGCLQWNRKAPFDLQAFGKLIGLLP